MRRPRSKLQVSMFPFLAVLLCVMGALLLILFVMDRRAKIVAQHKVSEIKSERLARSKAEEEARQAEWEKAKQALHQSLLAQQDDLKIEAKSLDNHLTDASKKLAQVKASDQDLKRKIAAESEKIALLQVQLVNQQDGVKESAKKENLSRAELLEAAKELADLELAFKKLRALKENDKKTYSVVPYRGKHGDMRPPIYVECVGAGVLFHPEKELLAGPYFSPTRVRSEVERRAGPLVVQKASSKDKLQAAESTTAAYVLFLVRPDGIENYYKAQSFLKGYQLDFGYELVDQHWTLDFGPAPKDTPPISFAKGSGGPSLIPSGFPSVPPDAPTNGGQSGKVGPLGNGLIGPPNLPTAPLSTGSAQVGSTNLPQPSRVGIGNGPPSLPIAPFDTNSVPIGPPSLSPPTAGAGPANQGLPLSLPLANGKRTNPPTIGTPPMIGNPSYNSVNTGIPVQGPSFVPISQSVPPPIPIATTGARPPVGKPSAKPAASTDNALKPTDPPNGEPPPDAAPANAPYAGERSGTSPNAGNADTGINQESSPAPPFRPLPNFGSAPTPAKNTPPAPPIGRVIGNKDFVITIHCYGDRVSVLPGGMTFRWTSTNVKATDQALVQGIKNLIAKRQASVRPGEPPYRPLIRFQVSAEGLRTYYQAYPLLESLGVPMRRENIDD